MDAFAIPLVVFFGFLAWLLVEIIRGSFEEGIARQAGVIWAVTCPLTGVLFAMGLGPFAMVTGAVSLLALGTVGYWFLGTEADDAEDEAEEPVAPDDGPSDDIALEVAEVPEPEPDDGIDWAQFDRLRVEWEKELAPEPEREPEPERVPAGV